MLKQSTSVIVLVGPVLDSSGVAYTGMSIADLNITKNGSTAAMSGNTFSHSHEGHYLLTLTTTNTNTLGNLVISCNKSTYAMPPARFRVLHANVYDVTFGSTAPSTYAGGDTSGVTTLLSRVTGAVALASALVTAQASLDAINTKTTNLPTDPADQSLIIAATDALLAAINALNNLSAAQVRTELSTELGRIDQTISSRSSQTSVDDLPTNAELTTALAAADDAMLAAIGAVQSDTNDIQTRLPAALVGGKMDSSATVELTEGDIDQIATEVSAAVLADLDFPTPAEIAAALTDVTNVEFMGAPVSGTRMIIVRGSAYLKSQGTAPYQRIAKAAYPDMGLDTVVGFRMKVYRSDDTFEVIVDGVIESFDATYWNLYANLSSTDTALLIAGEGIAQFWVELDGIAEEITVSEYKLTVKTGIGVA